MIEDITNAICKQLNEVFNDGDVTKDRKFDIFQATVTQGFKKPSFLVMCLQVITNRKNTLNYQNTYQYAIQYYSTAKDTYNDCLNVYENVCNVLKTVKIGDIKAHCFKFDFKILDGVLTVTCSYTLNLIEQKESDAEILNGLEPIRIEVK